MVVMPRHFVELLIGPNMFRHLTWGLTQQANRRPTRGRKPAGGRPVERRVRPQAAPRHGSAQALVRRARKSVASAPNPSSTTKTDANAGWRQRHTSAVK